MDQSKHLPSLYLGQSVPTQVDSDGRALHVSTQGQTLQRVPLPRIDRILSGPLADWCGPALLACAQARIPVVFATNATQACASLAPLCQASGRLDAELTFFAESPQAETAWREGLRALRARLLREWWQAQPELGPPEGSAWENVHREFVYHGAQLARRMSQADPRCYAVVAAQLHQQGLALRYPTRGGRWIELALDLCATLQDLRELMSPLEQQARSGLKLRAQAFETSAAAQTDTVSWCLLILRRSALEHVAPWL